MMKKIITVFLAASLLSCGPAMNGSTIRLAMEDEVLTLNPYEHDDSIAHSVLSNIYDALVAFDPEMRVVPALAVRWENPSDLVWRFFLRPEVKFHNGRRLQARDVKYSLELAQKGKVGHYISSIEKIEIVDSLTVELITSKPAPLLLNKLTFIGIVPEDWRQLEERPMGTGAYCFQRYEKGATLELFANPNFWGGRPRIKKAIFVKLPDDSSRCWALLNGDVQLIRDTGERFADEIKNSPQVNFLSRPGLGVTLLGVNFNLKSPLLKRQVRQAIYLALDPAELISESKAEAEPTDQLVTPYIVGYLPDLPSQRPMLAKARKLMAAAGYPRGFAMDIEMSKTAAQRSGPYIARQLKQLGINVNVKGLDWGNMFRRLDRGVSPFFLVGWSNSSGDASDLLEACLHTRERGRYGNANWGGYSNARLDRIIEQSQASIDSRERVQLMQQAMKMALDDMPWIPLYVRSRTYGASAKINFVPRQDGRIKVFEISYTE